MFKKIFPLFAFLTISATTVAHADNPAKEHQASIGINEFSARFVMQISTVNADLFSGSLNEYASGTGTGFIYKIRIDPKTRKKYAVVFTNKHVVSGFPFNKRFLNLSFYGPNGTTEDANATLIYESPRNDFAALRFEFKELSKTMQNQLMEGLFPEKDSLLYDPIKNLSSIQGNTEVWALGNPLGGENISTSGPITGKQEFPEGVMILTQAPINPGNSGGPMVTKSEGIIIGINSAKYEGADNMGFAIPINEVIEEFEAWEKNKSIGHNKGFQAISNFARVKGLELHGVKDLIETQSPGYFKRHKGAMIVHSALPESNLQAGDYFFRVNGKEIGLNAYVLAKEVQFSNGTIKIDLVRNHTQAMTVEVPIVSRQYQNLRETIDMVFLSGLIFAEKTGYDSFLSFGDNTKRVWLVDHIESAQTSMVAKYFPPVMSVLKAVRIKGETKEIHSLRDLKNILKGLPEDLEHLEIVVYEPLTQKIKTPEDGDQIIPVTNAAGGVQHNPHAESFTIPITKVLMYPELDMKGFEEQFKIDLKAFKTRDFFEYTERRRLACEEKLKTKSSKPKGRKK